MTKRSTVKNFVLVGAGGSFACAVLTLGLAFWSWMTDGNPVYTGSFFATTFFFFSVAVVMYEMSLPQQPLPVEEPDAKDARP
jgi:hypothetical protein